MFVIISCITSPQIYSKRLSQLPQQPGTGAQKTQEGTVVPFQEPEAQVLFGGGGNDFGIEVVGSDGL